MKLSQVQLEQKLESFKAGQKQTMDFGAPVESFGTRDVAPRPQNVAALTKKFTF